MIIYVVGLYFTQQILNQDNFTKGNFTNNNNYIKLISDINVAQMTFSNNVEFSARLDGNGHKITGNRNTPLFDNMMGTVYNLTIDTKLSRIFENGLLTFVNVTATPFTNLQSCNISHIIVSAPLGDGIFNSLISDVKIQNVQLAKSLQYSNISNIVIEISDQSKIQNDILLHSTINCLFTDMLVYAGKLSFSNSDSYQLISQSESSQYTNITVSIQELTLADNSSFTILRVGYNLVLNYSNINIDNLTVSTGVSSGLIAGIIQGFKITGNVIKIGNLTGTSTKQYSFIYLISYQNSTIQNTFINNLVIVDQYSQDKGYINFISEIMQQIVISNNHFQINNLTMVQKTRQYSTFGYEIDSSSIDSNTIAIPTINITYSNTTTQNLRLNYLVTKLTNTTVRNLQLLVQEQYVNIKSSAGQFQLNGISTEVVNTTFQNVSIIFNNFSCNHQNISVYICGVGYEINQTQLSRINIQFNNINITSSGQSGTPQNEFYGIGKTLTDFKLDGGTINENLLDGSTNNILFLIITIKNDQPANFSVEKAYGYFNQPNHSSYQGGLIQLNAVNCYITRKHSINNFNDVCKDLNSSNIQDSNLVGFTEANGQSVWYIKDLVYVENNIFKNWMQYRNSVARNSFLYGSLEEPSQSNNYTYQVKCTQQNTQQFTCQPLTTKATCQVGSFGYDCQINNCYFTSPSNCNGYFPKFDTNTQALDSFGSVISYDKSVCMYGKYVNNICLCDLGFTGTTCSTQNCSTYMQLGDKCKPDDTSNVTSTCSDNGMCLCSDIHYYVVSNDSNGQSCQQGCNNISNGICVGQNKAACNPGYSSPENPNEQLCSISECVNIPDYNQCGGQQGYKCYGWICLQQQTISECENGCNGMCFGDGNTLKCVEYCNNKSDLNANVCIDVKCENNCNDNGACVISHPEQHILPNTSKIVTVGQCNCYDKLMLGLCDQCQEQYHIYQKACLPNNCTGFYDSQSCKLKAGYVVGVFICVILVIGIIIGAVFLTLFLLRRKRHRDAVHNKIQQSHFEVLHYQL